MCLAVPARITRIDGSFASADLGGIERSVCILFTPEARVGDYVIMHAGYALSLMDRAEAEETLALFDAIAGADEF